MGQEPPLRTSQRATPARVAGVYLLFSLAWIWLSDRVLMALGLGEAEGFWAAAAKGTAFVVASAALLYWFVSREMRALTRTLSLLRAVTEGTTDAVFVKDRDGRYLLINRAGAECLGRRQVGEVLGRTDDELFDRSSAARLRERDRRVVETGRTDTAEEELTAAGVTRTYQANKAPYRDATGTVVGVIGVSRDVTDRKRVADALRASEERYRALFEAMPVAVWEEDLSGVAAWFDRLRAAGVADLRAHLAAHPDEAAGALATVRVLSVNREAVAQNGAATEAELRAALPHLFTDRSRATWVEELAHLWVGRRVVELETEGRRLDGGRIGQVLRLHLPGPPGAPEWGRVIVTGIDVTARKFAAEALRASQRQYQQLVATIDGIVWAVDPNTLQFTFVSEQAERLLGYPTAQWTDEVDFWVKHMHPDDRAWALDFCLAATRALRSHDFEYRMLAADGRVVWVRDIVTVVVEGEAVVGLCGVMIDVTAQKRAEAFQARQSEVLEGIAFGRALADTLAEIVRLVETELPGTTGSVLLLDRDGARLRHGAAPGLPPAYAAAIDGVAIGPRVGSCGTAAYTREPVLVEDIATDPLWADYKGLALGHGLAACWSAPILGTQRGGDPRPVLGTFAVYARAPGAPPARFAEVVARAEHLARVAIESDRADRELRESEGRYRALVETSTDGIFVTRGGRISFANGALARMLGAGSPERLVGRSALDLIHPDDHADSRAAGAAVRATGRPLLLAGRRFVRLDGSTVDVEVNAAGYEDRGESAFHVTVRDVTERRRAEEALRASEERYRETVEAATDAIVTTDPQGNIVGWNRGAERVFGWTADEAVGRDVELIVPPRYAAQHHAAMTAFDPVDSSRMRGRVVELAAMRKDGGEFPAEIALAHFGAGADRRFTAVIRDVTERHRAERALREREEQLRLFVDQVWAAIALVDCDMRYVYASRRWLADYRLGDRDLTGLGHYDVFPDIPDRWKDVYKRCLAGAEERCDEDRFERADGTVQWVRWEVRPWRRGGGAVAGLVMCTEDITARKRLEAHYQQAAKMEAVGRLAGGIAHDFNNLLTVINGFSDMALRDADPDDPHREALAQIRGAGERAARLTQQLLAYGRKAMIEPKVLDLNELVTESAKLVRLVGEDVLVSQLLAPGAVRVRADRGQLEQVLMNLVVNARDAMPAGGRLTIETGTVALGPDELPEDPDLKPGRYARLVVADTGSGIPEEVRAHIFEPFFTTKGVGKGTGLGLAVVHGAVKQAGGHISVASTVGAGTAFTLLFPAIADAPAPAPEALLAPARGTETVLLVEDEDAVRTITRLALEERGYAVLAAGSGPDALALADRHPGRIDLLVTDVVMPHLGGRELAAALRARRPDLRVLFISGYTNDVMLRHGLTDATDAFLQKPYTPADLARTVRDVLDRGG